MKKWITPTCFALLLGMGACKQDQYEVSIDTKIQTPVVTKLPNGSRQVELTMVVTQLGNYYYQDFYYDIKKFQGTMIFDSLTTTLPTAREFIQCSFTVPGPGLYYVTMALGTESDGASSGETLEIP